MIDIIGMFTMCGKLFLMALPFAIVLAFIMRVYDSHMDQRQERRKEDDGTIDPANRG